MNVFIIPFLYWLMYFTIISEDILLLQVDMSEIT
jgi:hypothetical protein